MHLLSASLIEGLLCVALNFNVSAHLAASKQPPYPPPPSPPLPTLKSCTVGTPVRLGRRPSINQASYLALRDSGSHLAFVENKPPSLANSRAPVVAQKPPVRESGNWQRSADERAVKVSGSAPRRSPRGLSRHSQPPFRGVSVHGYSTPPRRLPAFCLDKASRENGVPFKTEQNAKHCITLETKY